MTRPSTAPDWATDAAYTHGPVPGLPNKSAPSTGEQAEGFIPTEPIPADMLNWVLNNHGSWIDYLAAAIDAQTLGDGVDGAVTFDGVSTVLGMVPAGGVYSLSRDIRATSITFTGNAQLIVSSHTVKNFRLFFTGTLDTTGSALGAGVPVIIADGQAAGIGPPAQNITGGLSGAVGTLRGGAAGGGGAVNLAGSSPGGNGTSDANSIGGNGGQGGASGGGGAAGGAAGLASLTPENGPFTYTIWQLAGLIAGSGGLIALGGGGGGGGGATNAGTSGGGGGGAGGGIICLIGRTLKLRAASDLHAWGGAGIAPLGSSGNPGGGGGGGGGALLLAYVEKLGGIVFSAAAQCGGGLAGAGAGTGLPGAIGGNGNVYEFVIVGGNPAQATEQHGIAGFSSGGSGAGFDYVDIALSPAMPNTAYVVTLGMGMNDDVSGGPTCRYTLKTTAGFRIRTNAQFNGEVSWVATPA